MKQNYFPMVWAMFFIVALFCLSSTSFAQVGIGNTDPDPSALLDIKDGDNDKGILIPRVNITDLSTAAPVASPATSLLVYNTNTTTGPGFFYWNGSRWIGVDSGGDWKLRGNMGTNPNNNFLGTTDAVDLRIRTNNNERFTFTSNGRLRSHNDGTAAEPTYSWSGANAQTMGMFRAAAHTLGFSTNGVERFRIPNANQVHALSNGTATAPFYSWSSDTNTGIYLIGPDEVGVSTGGVQRMRVLPTGKIAVNYTAALGSERFYVDGNTDEYSISGDSYGNSGKGVFGYHYSGGGMGVHGQTSASGYGVFAASTGSATGLTAVSLGTYYSAWVQQSNVGNGLYVTTSNGLGIMNNITGGSGTFNKILSANYAGTVNDMETAGGIGEAIFLNNRNGIGVSVNANPTGTGGDVWAFVSDVKTNSALSGGIAYGGIMGGNQYGRGHGLLLNHLGTTGRNAEFNTHTRNNTEPNVQAISLNRAPTIVAQNQSNNVGRVLAVADISFSGTDGRDHIAISGFSSPVPYYGYGVVGTGGWMGVHGIGNGSTAIYGVFATGDSGASGVKTFAIDDPRDPANKILRHASIESNEILNLYRGVETFGDDGRATVVLPQYYDIININPSYQLTPIGAAMNLYIEKEVENGAFEIAGGIPGKKVSWILTAERNDPYLQQYPEKREMEVDKGVRRGQYFMPELYGQPKEKGMGYYEPTKAEMSIAQKPENLDYLKIDDKGEKEIAQKNIEVVRKTEAEARAKAEKKEKSVEKNNSKSETAQ